MIIVADGSHWRTVNPQGLRTNGVDGLMWKATDGGSFVDSTYNDVRNRSNSVGIPFCAMHYQEENFSVTSEVANISKTISKDTAIVIDVEKNSGNVAHTQNLIQSLTAIGYHVPFVYLPKWYWESIGKPDLKSLPPLWASRYLTASGDPRTLISKIPFSWWDGYGNNSVALLQFTSSGKLPNSGTVGDFSLFSGDAAQFARYCNPGLFEYSNLGDKVADNVPLPTGKNVHVAMTCAGYSKFRIPLGYADQIELLEFDFVFDTRVNSPDPAFVPGAGFNSDPDGDGDTALSWKVQPNRPGPWPIPPGATELSLRLTNNVPAPTVVYLGLSN